MLLEKDIDKKLYREFLAGNKEALGKLIYKYRNSLIYFIFKYVRNQETAEDIFQDVMVYLLDKKEVYNFDYSFKTFLYIVAKSRALNYIKNKKIEDELTDNEKNLFVEEELLEEIILSKERQTNIRNVISKMNHEYQMVIFLGIIEGISYNEIAKIMNKSTSQIKNLLHRARIKLRKLLIQERIVEMKNNRAIRFLMWFIVLGLITSGVVYATSYYINYIWKEPEKYNLQEESKVTEEDEVAVVLPFLY